jgi:hypothetical protein
MKKLLFVGLLSILTLNLSAQSSDSLTTKSGTATVINSDEINSAAKKGSGLPLADSVLRVVSIEGKYNVGVSVVTRSKINGKTPADAIVHNAVTEVYHIAEGRGILVTGGSLDSSVGIPSDSRIVLNITGPSSTGKRIIGGIQHEVGPKHYA